MNFLNVFLVVFLGAPFCMCQYARRTLGTIQTGSSHLNHVTPIAGSNPKSDILSVASLHALLNQMLSNTKIPNARELATVTNQLTVKKPPPVINGPVIELPVTKQPTVKQQPTVANVPTVKQQPTVANVPTVKQQPTVANVPTVTNNHILPNRHYHRQRYVIVDNNNHLSAFETNPFAYSFGLRGKLKREILGKVNQVRQEVTAQNMNCLLWSDNLAAKAAKEAKQCTYHHTNKAAIRSMVYEKEIGNKLIDESLTRWKEEEKYFYYGKDCRVTGGCQFSQIVWAKSEKFGCAAERCGDMTNMVCLFEPEGNVSFELPYYRGEPCMQCPARQGSIPRCNTDQLCEWYPGQ